MTIQEQWEELERLTVPQGAPDFQRDTMKKCFYAGFMAAFSLVQIISHNFDEDSACARLSELDLELKQFMENENLMVEIQKNGIVH